MNRGKQPSFSGVTGFVTVHAAFLGGGAATDCTLPADGVLTDAAAGLYPKQANFGTSCKYAASTGVYTVVLSETFKNILFATAAVVSDGASPTATLEAAITKITPGTGLTVKVFAPNGTLTDLGTSDLLIIKVDCADTSAINGVVQ